MMDGIIVMFEVALALLRRYQVEILRMKDAPDLITFIRKASSQLNDPALLKEKV